MIERFPPEPWDSGSTHYGFSQAHREDDNPRGMVFCAGLYRDGMSDLHDECTEVMLDSILGPIFGDKIYDLTESVWSVELPKEISYAKARKAYFDAMTEAGGKYETSWDITE